MPQNQPANQTVLNESRVERKQRLARMRIIEAAETLMRSQPIDEVTIAQITEAADVGHGTFYLHFSSKSEVLIPITRDMAAHWDSTLQTHFRNKAELFDDPAIVVGHSARYMGRAVIADPLWRWMLKHSGVPIDDIRDAIGRFASRDFKRGFDSGRFQIAGINVMNSFLVGGFVACLLSSFESSNPDHNIDLMAELLLRTLGVEQTQAAQIAHMPLQPLHLSTN